jgi:hypothetical protein
MREFTSLREALQQGFYVQERTPEGYAVVTRTSHGLARAFVKLGNECSPCKRGLCLIHGVWWGY